MNKLLALLKKLGASQEQIAEAEAIIQETEEGHQQAIETEVQGLKKKNQELLKKLKEQDGEAAAKVPELEDKIQELTEQNKKLTKDLDTTSKENGRVKQELTDKLASEQRAISQMLVDSGLSEGLAKLKVRPEHIAILKDALSKRATVESEGDVRKAMVMTKDKDGKDLKLPLSDYLEKHWATSDEGKAFLPGSGNSGSGGAGAGGGQGAIGDAARYAELNAKDPAALSGREQAELVTLAGKIQQTQP